jgi:hypothetical protein
MSTVYIPPPASSDLAVIMANLTRAGVDIAKLGLIQPGTTLTASGAISRQNPGYSIPGTNTVSAGLNLGGSTGLVLLGLAAMAMFMFSRQR